MNMFEYGWIEQAETLDGIFQASSNDLEIVSESVAKTMILEFAKTPVKTHPFDMAEILHLQTVSPYKRLTVWNQDANNCAAHGTARAVEAFQLINAWRKFKEIIPFEIFVPWIYGVGKNEAGYPGDTGASIGWMLDLIVKHGVLPADTPNLPNYKTTSLKWCRNYGKNSQNAPYSPFWPEAKKHVVKAARLPKDADIFYHACKAGFTIAFGTSQKILMSGTGKNRVWNTGTNWMHAMAAYGYNDELDAVGIDNSHGDGFAWASRAVLHSVVERARYFDGFIVIDIKSRPGTEDWSVIGRN